VVDDVRVRATWVVMIGPPMYVSALSLGPRGLVQILNFVVFAWLLLAFCGRGRAGFRGAAGRSGVGPALLTIIAFGYLLSGPFPMDPDGI
jgi:hypothetical protein